MIFLRDLLRLSKLKIKVRKWRYLITSISISLGLILLISVLIGSNGLIKTASKLLASQIDGKYYIVMGECSYPTGTDENGLEIDYEAADSCNRDYSLDDINSGFPDYSAITKHQWKYSNPDQYFGLIGISEDFVSDEYGSFDDTIRKYVQLSFVEDDTFVKEIISEDVEFFTEDEVIPVIVPFTMIANDYFGEDTQKRDEVLGISALNASKELLELKAKIYSEYIGKEYELGTLKMPSFNEAINEESEPEVVEFTDTDIKVKIAGISTPDLVSFSHLSELSKNSYIMPSWALEEHDKLRAELENDPYSLLIFEYQDKSSRNNFMNDFYSNFYGLTPVEEGIVVTPYITPYESILTSLADTISLVRNIFVAIGVFIMLISMLLLLFTISKIVSDSTKEIAVFRSFGAKRGDIAAIFFGVVIRLATSSFLIGLSVSVLLTTLLSLKYGESTFYSMLSVSTRFLTEPPLLTFMQPPLTTLFFVYLFVLFVAVFASLIPIIRAVRIDPIKALREE